MKVEWHLRSQDYFSGLEAEKEIFISLAKKRCIKRHEILFRQGDHADSAFYLQEGRIVISSITAEGKEIIVFIRNAGEMLGLAEAFGGFSRTCNARGMTPCSLYEIKRADLQRLLAQSWSMSRRVMETLGGRLRFLSEQLGNLMSCDVTARLGKLLYYLSCQRRGEDDGREELVDLPIKLTQEDIAAMIGSCQQTVSEALKQLEKNGLIRLSPNRREIIIPKPAKLADFFPDTAD